MFHGGIFIPCSWYFPSFTSLPTLLTFSCWSQPPPQQWHFCLPITCISSSSLSLPLLAGHIYTFMTQKTCSICVSEFGLFSLLQWFLVLPTFLQISWFCFYGCTDSLLCMDHISSIRVCVDGHLIVAVSSTACTWMCIHLCWGDSDSFGSILRSYSCSSTYIFNLHTMLSLKQRWDKFLLYWNNMT